MPDEDEARFLIKEFVIPGQERLEKKIDAIAAEQVDLRLQGEITKAKVSALELAQLKICEELEKHKEDMERHYNPYFSETLPQKLWRKKPEIAAGGGLGSILAAFLYLLINHFMGG